MSDAAPAFPYAATLVAPLRAASERAGSVDYMQTMGRSGGSLGRSMPADDSRASLLKMYSAIGTREQGRDALARCSRHPVLSVTAAVVVTSQSRAMIGAAWDVSFP